MQKYTLSVHPETSGAYEAVEGRTKLTGKALWQQDAYRMMQRRAKAVGMKTRIGNHTFGATGIAAHDEAL